jgi:hypothetical protein
MKAFKRTIGAVVTAALLTSGVAYAAADSAPLPAGKPAGTKEAALLALGPIFWIGLAAAIAGITAAAASSGSNNKTTTATTTGTGA